MHVYKDTLTMQTTEAVLVSLYVCVYIASFKMIILCAKYIKMYAYLQGSQYFMYVHMSILILI